MAVAEKKKVNTKSYISTHYTVIEDPIISEKILEIPDYVMDENSPVKEEKVNSIKEGTHTHNRSRVFETFASVGLIIMVGLFVGLLLYPQMELSKMSRDNSDLKDEIAVLKRNVIDSEEDVNGINDVDSIRAQALALGMQDPNSNQIVSLPMPKDDKLVTVVSYDEYGISDEAYQNAVDSLSAYYLSQMGGEA